MSAQKTRGRSGPRFDPFEAVTARIIAALENGTVPWRQSWRGGGAQANLVSRKPYRGVNQLLLPLAGFESPWWLTFKQLDALGARIQEGQARRAGGPGPSLVTFYRTYDRDEEATGETRKRFVLRAYSVWNADQLVGLPAGLVHQPDPDAAQGAPIDACEALLARYLENGGPSLAYGGDSAHYLVATDHVQVPGRERFDCPEALYAVAFHECAHSTGAAKRLKRPELLSPLANFGSDPYAKEELVAEISAAMLCARARIATEALGDNTAAYIANWLAVLRGDNRFVISAAAKAQRAADLIAGVPGDERADDGATPLTGAAR